MADVFDRLNAAMSDRYAIERELGWRSKATLSQAEKWDRNYWPEGCRGVPDDN